MEISVCHFPLLTPTIVINKVSKGPWASPIAGLKGYWGGVYNMLGYPPPPVRRSNPVTLVSEGQLYGKVDTTPRSRLTLDGSSTGEAGVTRPLRFLQTNCLYRRVP